MIIKYCELCGKEFQTRNPRAKYCKDDHYIPCPVCGKPVRVKQFPPIPRACSRECANQRAIQTSLEKYGVTNAGGTEESLRKQRNTNFERYGCLDSGNRPEAIRKRKQTLRTKYGVDCTWDIPGVPDKIRSTNLQKFGTEWAMQSNDVKQKSVQGCMDKYGVSNPMQSNEVQSKAKVTNKLRYGNEWAIASPQVRAKSQRTMMKRYGTIHPTKLAEIQAKTKATNLVRYGVPHPMMTDEIKKKVQDVMLERYGVDNVQKCEDIKNRTRETNLMRYGVPAAICLPENMEKAIKIMRDNLGFKISSYNRKFGEMLQAVGLEIEYEKGVGGKWFDIWIKGTNILIEIDPSHTHSIQPAWYGKGIDKNYHRDKTLVAQNNGYRCIHVFDWDDVEKIINLVRPILTSYYGRQVECSIIPTDQAESFLDKFHIQGSVGGQEICFGLVKDDYLLSVMTFGAPKYNRKYQWELLRYCTAPGIQVIDGASKLLHSFITELNPKSILSYCNLAKFTGRIYEEIGMECIRTNSPSKLWSKEDKVITDALLHQRGYDQLFGTNYGKGTSNEQLMIEHGWRTVYDCGQAVYEWIKQSDLQ